MITKITITNFKKLEHVSFTLSQSVLVIGPNNSGKSSIFQALCLWELGVKKFLEAEHLGRRTPAGTAIINRRDLVNTPISDARSLWPKQDSSSVERMAVYLDGEDAGEQWWCRAEFEFENAESISCRINGTVGLVREMYEAGRNVRFGFLQPMSGISMNEDKLTPGSVVRKLGEGRTAEVLRNLCFDILHPDTPHVLGRNGEFGWSRLCDSLESMYGIRLMTPEWIKSTGIILLEYVEGGVKYDIAAGGRGFQQTLLLLAYMYANPGTVLLLDEPDAHLEVLRQREAFQLINQVAAEVNTQIIIASHSEVLLDEAAEASKVVALIENKVFELNADTGGQNLKYIRKALTEIGWEKYYLARLKKHVLYLEGSTDLQMLRVFAEKLRHPCAPLFS